MAVNAPVPAENAWTRVLEALPAPVRAALRGISAADGARVHEIRICLGRPIMVTFAEGDRFVTSAGLSQSETRAVRADAEMVAAILDALTHSSVYAVEEAMREGYLSLSGGHRVGLLGELRLRDGRVEGYRRVVGFNIRINRPVPGAALPVLPHLIKPGGGLWSTLILSPPGCGKTTLLRDLIRRLSYGDPAHGLRPCRVGVADERSEIAACAGGLPQNDLGPRADVLDQCPKRHALAILLRAMGPEVLATDEIGHPDDVPAILDAAAAGVTLICTAHGGSVAEIRQRPTLRPLLASGLFERLVVLSRRRGPGTVEQVVALPAAGGGGP